MSWGKVQMISGMYNLDSKSELSYAKSEIKEEIKRYGNIEEYPDLGNEILPIISIETVCKSFEEAEELADSLDWKGKNSLLIPYKDVGDRDIWTIEVNTVYLNIYHEKNNLEKYIPSELLIKRFSLHNQNGNYLLTGYLHTAADFKEEDLLHIGGHCIKYSDSIYSFAIPLKILPQFITLPGITYIECSSPVRNR